jgi:formylglycine-generating enzyme required for sulfatase activity
MKMKMRKILSILTVFSLIAVVSSCVDPSTPAFEEGTPNIEKIDSDVKVVKDDLTIYGTNLYNKVKEGSSLGEPLLHEVKFLEILNSEKKWYEKNDADTSNSLIIGTVSFEDAQIWTNEKIVCKIPDSISTKVNAIAVTYTYVGMDEELDIEDLPYSDSYPIEIRKTDFVEVMPITAGTFRMGSETGNPDESPAHNVTLTKNMIIGKYEVNQRLYKQVTDTNPSVYIGDFKPVNNVTFEEAISFCNKLSELEGYAPVYDINDTAVDIISDANGWRLPTEAEWEYCCNAGLDTEFPYPNGEADKYAWFNLNSGFQVHSCGQLEPNSWGLYDMIGNVYEWCWDYKDTYSNSDQTAPTGPSSGDTHVLRGGSFIDSEFYLRSSNRKFSKDSSTVGFRILRYEE